MAFIGIKKREIKRNNVLKSETERYQAPYFLFYLFRWKWLAGELSRGYIRRPRGLKKAILCWKNVWVVLGNECPCLSYRIRFCCIVLQEGWDTISTRTIRSYREKMWILRVFSCVFVFISKQAVVISLATITCIDVIPIRPISRKLYWTINH